MRIAAARQWRPAAAGATMEAGPSGRSTWMRAPGKVMALCTMACLVAVTAYTVALGANGWLWFAWVVLGLATAGVLAIRVPR